MDNQTCSVQQQMEHAVAPTGERQAQFDELVRGAGDAVRNGNSALALTLYTDAIGLDPSNHMLLCARSAVLTRLGRHSEALEDARTARQLKPAYAKAYFREGVALQCLLKDADALVALGSGLAEDLHSNQLLQKFVQTALQSSIKGRLRPLYAQLQRLRLAGDVFVVISVIGQELLASGHASAASSLLQAALRVGTTNLRMRGSVFSALASAFWAQGYHDKAIVCMRQDLAITKALDDKKEECRAEGNLAAATYTCGNYRECVQHYRTRLSLALRLADTATAADTLSHLGHVYMAIGDSETALASHKECVRLLQKQGDKVREAREIGAVGLAYMSGGDVDRALVCHAEHLRLARSLGDRREEARALSSLGSAHHCRRDYTRAARYHRSVLQIAEETADQVLEGRACAGLGHASRCLRDPSTARLYHQRQLDCALVRHDKGAEGRACSNLAVAFQQLGEADAALKLHRAHLSLARKHGDLASEGRACGNIGNAYSELGQHELAVRFHRQELAISKQVCDRRSESSTHGNLAVAYQALKMHDKARQHYNAHLQMARELRDRVSEGRALSNLGNHASCCHNYTDAIVYYEQHMKIANELRDTESEMKSCHKLGYAHYCLGNYANAIEYYEKDLAVAKRLANQSNMARAYCNLGLAYKATGELEKAKQCQTSCLSVAELTSNVLAKLHALGNLGDVLMKERKMLEAEGLFRQQLELAKEKGECRLQATAYGNLGCLQRLAGRYDDAVSLHKQQLELCRTMSNKQGECRALGHLGHVALSRGMYSEAHSWYGEQSDVAGMLGDDALRSHAYANMAISQLNCGQLDAAIGLFEQQLSCLQSIGANRLGRERADAYSHLADIYTTLGDHAEAVRCREQELLVCRQLGDIAGEERAYRGLANAHRALGNLQQALVCFEKRLVVSHQLADNMARGCAYGELGCLHGMLGNYEQAISCLQQQLDIAREAEDQVGEGEAACAMGGIYQQMADYEKAVELHKLDLQIALHTHNTHAQCRAYGNVGLSYESLGDYGQAIENQKQQLSIAMVNEDIGTKILAYSSLGRVHHTTAQYADAIAYLHQGLHLTEQHQQREDEAKIRHRLGLALSAHNQMTAAREQLSRAAELFEAIRREAPENNEYKLTLFDLQTACYQGLQRVLVRLGLHAEALLVAERGRTRAFVDLLLQRQLVATAGSWRHSLESSCMSKDQVVELVNGQGSAAVVYYSIAAGYLYSWLIVPGQGIVKFNECDIREFENHDVEADTQSMWSGRSNVSTCVIDSYVGQVRDSLGIDSHSTYSGSASNRSVCGMSETESDDHWSEVATDLFTRLVSRRETWNSSSRSMSSVRSRTHSGQSPLVTLHNLLLAPLEPLLQSSGVKSLLFVLPADMYLVPFALLKHSSSSPCLCERFHILVVPSLASLRVPSLPEAPCTGVLAVGNPHLSPPLSTQWPAVPATQTECESVVELLGGQMLTGVHATRQRVLADMQHAEVLHFATHVSWQLCALLLSPSESVDPPSPADYLLTAADIVSVRLQASLVVLSDSSRVAHSDGVIALSRAFLAAGARTVLLCLWPTPAAPILLRALYIALLRGQPASAALSTAMRAVKDTHQYSHPTHWAGWLLVGADATLHSQGALIADAFTQLLRSPDLARNAFRVLLHLVEKCLQRMQRGQRNAMYTTQESIARKAGYTNGWKQLLTVVGFRFQEASHTQPAVIFFPTSDPADKLAHCSASLQAVLGLRVDTLHALSKFVGQYATSQALIQLLRNVISQSDASNGASGVLGVKFWHTPGCHEFLASLGFDLVDVGTDEVTVKAGRQANKRVMRFALRTMLVVFDAGHRMYGMPLQSCTSVESLLSTTGSHTSNASKHSYFNPCEVDKWPSAQKFNQVKKTSPVPLTASKPNLSLHLSHQSAIRHKYSSSASDTSDATVPVGLHTRRPGSARNSARTHAAVCSTSSASENEDGQRSRRGRSKTGSSRGSVSDHHETTLSDDMIQNRRTADVSVTDGDDMVQNSCKSVIDGIAMSGLKLSGSTSSLAEKILAETQPQRRAVEHMWAEREQLCDTAELSKHPQQNMRTNSPVLCNNDNVQKVEFMEQYTIPSCDNVVSDDSLQNVDKVPTPILYDVDSETESLGRCTSAEPLTSAPSSNIQIGKSEDNVAEIGEQKTHKIGLIDRKLGFLQASKSKSNDHGISANGFGVEKLKTVKENSTMMPLHVRDNCARTDDQIAHVFVNGMDSFDMFTGLAQQKQGENSEDSGYSQTNEEAEIHSSPTNAGNKCESVQSLSDMLLNGVTCTRFDDSDGKCKKHNTSVSPISGSRQFYKSVIKSTQKSSPQTKLKTVKFEDEVRSCDRFKNEEETRLTDGHRSKKEVWGLETGGENKPVAYKQPPPYRGRLLPAGGGGGEHTPQSSWSLSTDDSDTVDINSPQRLQLVSKHFYMSSDDSTSSAAQFRPPLCQRSVVGEMAAARVSPEGSYTAADPVLCSTFRTDAVRVMTMDQRAWYHSDSDSSSNAHKQLATYSQRGLPVNHNTAIGYSEYTNMSKQSTRPCNRSADIEMQSSRC